MSYIKTGCIFTSTTPLPITPNLLGTNKPDVPNAVLAQTRSES